MQRIIERLKNEPAVVIGIVVATVAATLQSLAGQGVIGQDIVDTWSRLWGTIENPGPLSYVVVGIITRFFVSPPR